MTAFVGDPVAVVIGAIAVLVANEIGAVPLPDACDVVIFAEAVTKPELGDALGTDVGVNVGATVAFEEVAVGAVGAAWPAEYRDTASLFWLTIGAISWTTRLASACRKLVATGWSEEGIAVTHAGRGTDVVVM